MLPVLALDSIFHHAHRVLPKQLTQFQLKLKNLPVRLHYWRIHRRNLLFGYPLLHRDPGPEPSPLFRVPNFKLHWRDEAARPFPPLESAVVAQ